MLKTALKEESFEEGKDEENEFENLKILIVKDKESGRKDKKKIKIIQTELILGG